MKYVIAGLGRFGRLALDRLSAAFTDAHIIAVEKKTDVSLETASGRVTLISGDAVSFLVEASDLTGEDRIIPTVPFHLAASYLLARYPTIREVDLPSELAARLPNSFSLNRSNLCCSRADFLCPDDCPEGDVCTVTGEPREDPLYGELARIVIPGFTVPVLRSEQVLPGIGGYSLSDLWNLGERIHTGRHVIATACKCHGIMTGIEKRETPEQ